MISAAILNPKPVYGDEPPPTGTPTALYRLFSYDADLLYVGITDNPDRRLREHAKTQSWWHQVEPRLTQLEWFASRPVAADWERFAIDREFPRHNIASNHANLLYRDLHPSPTIIGAIRPGLPPEDGKIYWSIATTNIGCTGRRCTLCGRLITTRPGIIDQGDQYDRWALVLRCPMIEYHSHLAGNDTAIAVDEDFVWWIGRGGWTETWHLDNPGNEYRLVHTIDPAWA